MHDSFFCGCVYNVIIGQENECVETDRQRSRGWFIEFGRVDDLLVLFLDALHSKVCGVCMMIDVLHTMEITGNHMFFYSMPPPFMPFAQKYDMYKYVDTCTYAICKVYMR